MEYSVLIARKDGKNISGMLLKKEREDSGGTKILITLSCVSGLLQ